MMTQADREAAYQRVRRQLGLDTIGSGSHAPPLPPRRRGGRSRGSAPPIESETYAAVRRYEYGEIWGRPGLEPRRRSFISMAAVAAMGHEDQLYRQVDSALNLGITPEEVHEASINVSVYGGISAWDQAMGVANERFTVRGPLSSEGETSVEFKPALDEGDRKAAAQR
jgi:4-carboxymuconolactone decarboxylase